MKRPEWEVRLPLLLFRQGPSLDWELLGWLDSEPQGLPVSVPMLVLWVRLLRPGLGSYFQRRNPPTENSHIKG